MACQPSNGGTIQLESLYKKNQSHVRGCGRICV